MLVILHLLVGKDAPHVSRLWKLRKECHSSIGCKAQWCVLRLCFQIVKGETMSLALSTVIPTAQ
jgi:hypothetical protein